METHNFMIPYILVDPSVVQRTFGYVGLQFHQPQPSIYPNYPMIPYQYHMQPYSYYASMPRPSYPYTPYSPSGIWINSSDQYRPSMYTTTFVDDAVIMDPEPPYRGFVDDGLLADDILLDMATNSVREYDDDLFEIDELMGAVSYEDLLEMEEQVGRVNVGLSEETISKHLKTTHVDHNRNEEEEGAEICVLCQDEYESNETVAILSCGHRYHADCIKEWLLQRNVCPICKSTALEV